MRYSLSTLLLVVLLVVIGCVALINASTPWATAFTSGVLFVVLVSVLGTIWRGGAARARWSGFALASGAYFLLAHGPGFADTVRPGLPTTVALNYLYPKIRQEVLASTIEVPDGTPAIRRGRTTYVAVPFEPDFTRVAHSMGVLLSGCLGATIAEYFYVKSTREEQQHR